MTEVTAPAGSVRHAGSDGELPCAHIDDSAVVRRSELVYWEGFDDGAVLLDDRTGALHILNVTAGLLWQCLDGTAAVGDVVADFAEIYGSREVVRDLEAAARALCREGLVEYRDGSTTWRTRHDPGHSADVDAQPTETPTADNEADVLDPSLSVDLGRQRWAYDTARFQALGFDFTIRTTSAALGRYLDDVLASLAVPGPATRATHRYSIASTPERHLVSLGDEPVSDMAYLGLALRHLMWDINRRAVGSMPDRVLVHAAAAARDGVALVLPASMNAGKTTLVAGLVRAGLDYLTDEAVAFDQHTLEIVPYAKPLAIESGSWEVLADLRPRDREGDLPGLHRFHWYVPPEAIRSDSVAAPSLPGLVIFPRYRALAQTTLTPIATSEAVRLMASESFNFHQMRQESLATLAAVARRSDTYRLTVGNLDEACRLVLSLLD